MLLYYRRVELLTRFCACAIHCIESFLHQLTGFSSLQTNKVTWDKLTGELALNRLQTVYEVLIHLNRRKMEIKPRTHVQTTGNYKGIYTFKRIM